MVELDLNDIVTRLMDLRMYSPQLARRMDHEDGLPEDAAPFLVERIDEAFARCEAATASHKADAHEELALWLVMSYRYYLTRLAKAENPWCFRFPKSELHTCH
jgi:hypothetical protein